MKPDAARYLPALLLILGTPALAQSEIYRCAQQDGTVAFQQMPCDEIGDVSEDDSADAGNSDEKDVDAGGSSEHASGFGSPFDEPANPPEATPPESPDSISDSRASCEQSARDAIDVIDLEMRKGYTREQGQAYLDELIKLTQQLRDCKRL
jgi:hypothetical protein